MTSRKYNMAFLNEQKYLKIWFSGVSEKNKNFKFQERTKFFDEKMKIKNSIPCACRDHPILVVLKYSEDFFPHPEPKKTPLTSCHTSL